VKNLKIFSTLNKYRSYLYDEIVRTPEFQSHPFYRGLVSFIIDHRTPIFFELSHPYEYAHFSQYFNYVLMRNDYPNDYIRDMFFMHDFVHMAFDNPIQPAKLTFDYFCEVANYNEYVASNDTEVLTYYRIPEMREKSFSYPILFDLISKKDPEMPSVRRLLDTRRAIVWDNNDCGLGDEEGASQIFAFLRKFKENNRVWCETWYHQYPELNIRYAEKRLTLPIISYDIFLPNYVGHTDEESYRTNVLYNVRVGLMMLGEPDLPTHFEACEEALAKFEGKVLMDEAAQIFNTQYQKSKQT
jgi:hypothetical protein